MFFILLSVMNRTPGAGSTENPFRCTGIDGTLRSEVLAGIICC